VGNTVPKLQEAVKEDEKSFDLRSPNLLHGNSKDHIGPTVRDGAPFARASKLPGHEVGHVISIFKY
jgi:hypothetical protein